MPETLERPLTPIETRIHALPREDLIRCALALAWYADPESCLLEDEGFLPVEGSSSICRDNGNRARTLLREIGVKR